MRPFEGVRVLDLTHVFAGPFCTFQLAALGADVIKVEPPHRPDMTRDDGARPELDAEAFGVAFHSQNAGKRAITLDLRVEAGCEAMRRLIASADVLVQNYAGAALEALGFGYEAAASINPRLIYCTLTGFGRTGPKADHPAYDVVIQAFSGLMAANGGPELTPVRVGPAMVDYGTGAQAALAVSAALYQRQVTGRGQQIDVAMLDAAMMLMSSSVVETLSSGRSPTPHGNAHPQLCGYRAFETKDGLLMVGAYTTPQIARLMATIGERARAAEIAEMSRDQIRAACRADSERIAARMLERSADVWETALNTARVPAARVRTIREALDEPQVAARQAVQECGAPGVAGLERLPVAGFTYAHGAPRIDRPPPRLGEHTVDVLTELDFTPAEIAGMRESGAV